MLLGLFLLSLLGLACCQVADDLVIDLGYARYQGRAEQSTSTNAWYGIPFAANVSGEQRFRPPRPVEKFGNLDAGRVYNATQPGPYCVQSYTGWSPSPSSGPSNSTVLPAAWGTEDCLTLDVLVPQAPRSTALPVLLEIHGGGYAAGCAECYDGHGLMQHAAGAFVFVTIQYRLGPYGFLASSEVMANGTANAGLLDQRMAIEWVYNHISAFGGDPEKITIGGGSAGGGSVSAQMILYGGEQKPVFRAAIAEYPWWQPYHSQDVYEDQYHQLLNFTGCGDLPCLRNVSEDALRMAAESSYSYGYNLGHDYGFGDFYYGPALDGDIVRNYPSDAFVEGTYRPIPLLTNRDGWEGAIFSNSSLQDQDEVTVDLQYLFPSANTSFFQQLYTRYPAGDFQSSYVQRSQIFGDAIVNCPTMTMAFSMSLHDQPVWKMRFNAGDKLHAADVGFLFGPSDGSTNGDNATLAGMMKDWYVSFIVHNDPNVESWSNIEKPLWPSYFQDLDKFPTILDVETAGVAKESDPDWNNNCLWWLKNPLVATN